jgi:hypothetical protein
MKVNSREQAWREADNLFPTDYIKDEKKSDAAGYDIYCSTCDGTNAWISDLDNRLEINLTTGETVNIWIEEEPQFKEYQISDALEVIDNAIYEIDDNVNDKLAEVTGIREARSKLYDAYKEIAKILKSQHPDSELYARYNLQNA